MKDLIFSIGRFCENHVEKIVLVLVSVVCAWLFFTRVIFSPNVVEVNGKTYAPGQVDAEVLERAKALQQRLQSDDGAETARAFDPLSHTRIDANHPANVLGRPLPQGFVGLFESPLSHLDLDVPAAMPSTAMAKGGDRRYVLPSIPPVTDVALNHIRAAAYVPVQELTPELNYDKAEHEPNDVDLVTVEAQFDVAALYRQFNAHFAGEEVAKEEWRDPCLAEPVLAAVQLQRRRLLDNGTWSDWREVPRSRTEANRELFQVHETLDQLPPGGLKVRLMQFDNQAITMDLLQPEAYRIATADEEWFPPSFYDKFKSVQKKIAIEERREEREAERERRDQTTSGRRRDTAGGFDGRSTTGSGGRYRSSSRRGGDTGYSRSRGRSRTGDRGGMYGGAQDSRSRRGSRGRRRSTAGGGDMGYQDMMYGSELGMEVERKPTTDEVYWEFSEKLLDWRTELAELEEPVLLWAFDDSADPGQTYQYRIRVGVFNPVAGTGQLVEKDMDKADQVILWSEFSEVIGPVAIPRRLYFFAKDVKERTKTATVEVARYQLGYWYTQNFQVSPGEVIGHEMEPQERKEREDRRSRSGRITGGGPAGAYADYGGAYPMDMMMPGGYGYGGGRDPDEAVIPEVVDYSTGNVLVDLVETNDWAGTPPNLQPRMYHEMLYSVDGAAIERMPVSMRNWPKNLVEAYQSIQTEKRKEREAFKDFKKGGVRSRVRPPGMEGYDGMYDEMMYGMPPGR
jgi:hypothetical protein